MTTAEMRLQYSTSQSIPISSNSNNITNNNNNNNNNSNNINNSGSATSTGIYFQKISSQIYNQQAQENIKNSNNGLLNDLLKQQSSPSTLQYSGIGQALLNYNNNSSILVINQQQQQQQQQQQGNGDKLKRQQRKLNSSSSSISSSSSSSSTRRKERKSIEMTCGMCHQSITQAVITKETPRQKISYCSMTCFARTSP